MGDMNRDTIDKILELSTDPADHIINIVDRAYWENDGTLEPIIEPKAKGLKVETLTSFCMYLEENPDNINAEAMVILHVENPFLVWCTSPLREPWRDRETLIFASHEEKFNFPFGEWLDLEKFIITAQVCFQDTVKRANLLQLLGNVVESETIRHQDDGVTQTVTAKTGIAEYGDASIPNTVNLNVWRTFKEIGAIPGNFVLRMQAGKGPKPIVALFETAEGIWRQEALIRIEDFLRGRQPSFKMRTAILV
jgi:hypothetical protein